MVESSQIIGSIFIFYSKNFGIQQRQKDDAQDYHDEILNRFCYKNGEKTSVHENVTKNSRKKWTDFEKKRKKETHPINI